jgi:hypothetical protein
MGFHKNAPLADIHVPYSFSYADQAAREGATGLLAEDEGKFARQLDNDTLFLLINHSPVTWKGIAETGAAVDHGDLTGVVGDGEYHPANDGQSVVLDKGPGVGFKVDLDTPSWGWRDLEGVELVDVVGGNAAALTTYNAPIREFSFGTGDIMDIRFHMPHDYLPGSNMFIHVHWSHNGTAISGTFSANIYHSYAKGHNQAPFSTPALVVMSYDTVDIATTPQYQHMISEFVIAQGGGGVGTQDTADLEVDGLFLVQFQVLSTPTITGGAPDPFVHRIDIHYQSTNMGTVDKAPNFYTQAP